jgi:hypothetical protein
MYFSKLKNVSKNIDVIRHRFKSLSVTQPGTVGLIISNICEAENKTRHHLTAGYRRRSSHSPDTNSLQMVMFQFLLTPSVVVVPRKSIPARTWTKCHRRQCPCTGTSIRWPLDGTCPLRLVGTIRIRCRTFWDRSVRLGRRCGHECHALHNQRIFVRSCVRRGRDRCGVPGLENIIKY